MNNAAFPGHLLRDRRIELGLSTEDVFRRTRISTQFIDALESGNLTGLPALCYTNGFIKSYCKLLEVDPSSYIDAFSAAAEPPTKRFSFKDYKELSAPPSMTGEWVMWLAICIVLVVSWTAYSVVVRPQAGVGQSSVQADAPALSDEVTSTPAPAE